MRKPEFRYRITQYDRSLVPNRLVGLLDDGVIDQTDWIARSGRSLGHPGWGWMYHTVLMTLDPDRSNVLIETGTNLGSTSIIVAQAIIDSSRHGVLHTIELDPELHEEANRRFRLAGVAKAVESHCGDSLELLPDILRDVNEVALAFLDGNHLYHHVLKEFELVVSRLRPGGLVVLDNSALIAEQDEDPRVNGALRTILRDYGGNLVNFPYCSWWTPGIAIWQGQPFDSMDPPDPSSFVSGR
jgi:cephalosporin hydroxylase